jgi:hypothetical protein
MSIFQKHITYRFKDLKYDNTVLFYCPTVFAKDGFHVSLQIHSSNYCSSENGYREFGHTMSKVEFGYPSSHEELLTEHAENPSDLTNSVGCVPVSVLEEIFEKHGGIDWEQTISVAKFNDFTK